MIVPETSAGHISYSENGQLDIHTGARLLSYEGCFFDRDLFADTRALLGDAPITEIETGSDRGRVLDSILEKLITADCHSRR